MTYIPCIQHLDNIFPAISETLHSNLSFWTSISVTLGNNVDPILTDVEQGGSCKEGEDDVVPAMVLWIEEEVGVVSVEPMTDKGPQVVKEHPGGESD
jgi:hypothetical protein